MHNLVQFILFDYFRPSLLLKRRPFSFGAARLTVEWKPWFSDAAYYVFIVSSVAWSSRDINCHNAATVHDRPMTETDPHRMLGLIPLDR